MDNVFLTLKLEAQKRITKSWNSSQHPRLRCNEKIAARTMNLENNDPGVCCRWGAQTPKLAHRSHKLHLGTVQGWAEGRTASAEALHGPDTQTSTSSSFRRDGGFKLKRSPSSKTPFLAWHSVIFKTFPKVCLGPKLWLPISVSWLKSRYLVLDYIWKAYVKWSSS